MRRTHCALLILFCAASAAAAAPSPEAVELHHLGLAELENERPEQAEQAYRRLIELLPEDPAGHANLAIAQLRQQKYDAAAASILRALAVAPEHPRVLAIQGELEQWTGDLEGGLESLRRAAAAAPEDPEILYAAYHLATTLQTEAAGAVAGDTLRRLARLRPENVVVLLQLGQRAIADGDRTVATGVYLRLSQLLWQVQPIALRALDMVTEALTQDDVSAARVPAIRLENVLKVNPMFRESLRELKTGIQGNPLPRLRDQPESGRFGEPVDIELAGSRLDARPTAGRALAAGDFDHDDTGDLARIRAADGGVLEIRRAAGGFAVSSELPAAGLDGLLAADLDNDGHLDLVGTGKTLAAVWLGRGDGTFEAAPGALGLAAAGAAAAAVIDFDIEGDLDLALAGGASGAADLYRNALDGPLQRVGTRSLPRLEIGDSKALAASDLDRDGDLDLVIGHARGVSWLDNLRQGRFVDRSADAGLRPGAAVAALAAADLDDDGFPDLVSAGRGLAAWHNRRGRFEPWQLAGLDGIEAELSALLAADLDNDGRLDLAAAGATGVVVLQRRGSAFAAVPVAAGPAAAAVVVAVDLDRDGDLDLAAAGAEGLHRLENRGGNRNGWLAVRLRGLDKGNSKNNLFGFGSVVEVRSGGAYQFRETAGDVTHLGLGSRAAADVLRVVWTNGVPQNRLAVEGEQRLVEEQLLKGSCPFLYAWDGDGFAFVTDLLWNAPLGLPVAPGKWAASDPGELVRVDGLVADGGVYRLRITEELWEAAFFDHLRLWVVDHPGDVEVASNLRVVPGAAPAPERVLASRALRPVAAAWDGRGRQVTSAVLHRDEVYADGYEPGPYQGVAPPWTFTFDLGEAPAAAVRLHLDGWIFPADASLNLAVAQRRDTPDVPPRLEVETADGWQVLEPNLGHPAGKTKTLVIDTPPLPPGARRLRIVTSRWLHWDRIAWTTEPADEVPVVRARLAPRRAELRFRGFSELARRAPNAPHTFDYARARQESPWLPFPGHYTRYGDVRKLLAAADDFSVILAPGDEIVLELDAGSLPPPAAGWRRTLFLESHGWDKDADRNTFAGERLEPLPFRAMTGYPFADGESYPDTPDHRAYRRDWLTREVP